MTVTRFAPSPTGDDIHIGNLRMAALNHDLARREHGIFVLRVEDTANDRLVPACTERIIGTMKRMGMEPDRIYRQSDNKELHISIAGDLVRKGKMFEKDGAIWFPAGEASYKDKVQGNIYSSWEPFVCIRSNGEPSFIFANAIDDSLLMELGELIVIRGNDHVFNTCKQIALYEAMGCKAPEYRSMPMILGDDGKPLSKRDRAGTVGKVLDMGILPECLYEYLLSIGNNKSPAHMDLKKLKAMNRDYMSADVCEACVTGSGMYWQYIKQHVRCGEDAVQFRYLWERPEHVSCEGLIKYLDCEKPVDAWIAAQKLDRKEAYGAARKSLCGSPYSLDLNTVLQAIGKEEAVERLRIHHV